MFVELTLPKGDRKVGDQLFVLEIQNPGEADEGEELLALGTSDGREIVRNVHSQGVKIIDLGKFAQRAAVRCQAPKRARTSVPQRQQTLKDMMAPPSTSGTPRAAPKRARSSSAAAPAVETSRGHRDAIPSNVLPMEAAMAKQQSNLTNPTLQALVMAGTTLTLTLSAVN